MMAMSLQLQEVMSRVEARSEVVGRNLEEITGWFNCHRGETNCIMEREKEARGFIIGAAHETELFKTCLDRMKDRACKCGQTPSEVGADISLRKKLGWNCPIPLPGGVSMWLLWLGIQFPFPFRLPATLVVLLWLVQLWSRLLRNPEGQSVRTLTCC